MKRKLISALLACALLAGTAAPAFAAEDTADTAAKTPAGIGAEAPALKVRQMGLLAVQKAVTENNSTVRMLRKNASAIESATSGSSSSAGSLNPGQAYNQLADTLQGIINDGNLSDDMKRPTRRRSRR